MMILQDTMLSFMGVTEMPPENLASQRKLLVQYKREKTGSSLFYFRRYEIMAFRKLSYFYFIFYFIYILFYFQPLPELPRIPGLVLSGSTFSDCLMVVQFLRNFGKVLGFDVNIDVPNLSVLQEGLLNIGDSMGEVQDLLVRLLSAAVCDPGLITGYKVKKNKI